MMRRFLAAIRFLTILPLPGRWGTEESALAGSVPFFPVVGAMLGGVAAAVAWGLGHAVPPLLGSAAIVVALLVFSGGLHMDGLSDTADGFLSSRPRERILEIMKDSHVGPMGVIAVVCVLLIKFAAVGSLRSGTAWGAVLLMPLAGRCAIVVLMAVQPYARPGGLGTVFYGRRHGVDAGWAVAALAGAGWGVLRWPGLVIAGSSVMVALGVAWQCRRKIGGATGDTLGAACEIVEVVPAVALAIWQMHVVR